MGAIDSIYDTVQYLRYLLYIISGKALFVRSIYTSRKQTGYSTLYQRMCTCAMSEKRHLAPAIDFSPPFSPPSTAKRVKTPNPDTDIPALGTDRRGLRTSETRVQYSAPVDLLFTPTCRFRPFFHFPVVAPILISSLLPPSPPHPAPDLLRTVVLLFSFLINLSQWLLLRKRSSPA